MKIKTDPWITSKIWSYILLILSIVGVTTSACFYFYIHSTLFSKAHEKATTVLQTSLKKLNTEFELLENIANELSQEVTHNLPASKDAIKEKLIKIAESNPHVFGIGLNYEPYAFSQDKELFAPYYTKTGENGSLEYNPIEKKYNYTGHSWYRDALTQGAQWTEPYYGEASGTRLAEYAIPFYAEPNTSKPIGIVTINYSLDNVNTFINQLDLGATGYGFLVSNSGIIAAHPKEEYRKKKITLEDIAQEAYGQTLSQHIPAILSTKSDSFMYTDPLSGRKSYLFTQKIPSVQWTLAINFIKQEIVFDKINELYKATLWLLTCIMLFLINCVWILTQAYAWKPSRLWYWACISIPILCVSIVMLWYFQLRIKNPVNQQSVIISSSAALDRYLENGTSTLTTIPTGIELNQISMDNQSQITILGSTWQYSKNNSDTKPEFFIPQGNFETKDLVKEGNTEKNRFSLWSFVAKLYQQFDYTEFPFDYKHIKIPLSIKNNTGKLIAVPDLQSYIMTSPSSLPGITKAKDSEGWRFISSYFSYEEKQTSSPNADTAQLYFNIIIQRYFIYSLIAYILPLIVVLIILFLILHIICTRPKNETATSQNILSTITSIGSLFFVLITAHLALRQSISKHSIFYIEYFYIVSYFVLFITLTTVLGVLRKSKQLSTQGILLIRVLYWPMLLGIYYAITMNIFYT